ncbi:hypothetical protein C0995_012395 [Termitomyces sp. Mi166|nr:hypothetical protein C0995_012395 [Termitomyces sp. Mi166\
MSTPPVLPVLNEDLFVPDAIEFNMANNVTQPFYTFADFDAPGRTKTITHLEFGRAAHRVAHLLRPNRDGADGKVVAVILQADTILYQAIVAGLIVAGYVASTLFPRLDISLTAPVQPFPMSPRNTPGAIIELLTKTSCRRLLTTHAHLKILLDSIISDITDTPLADELQIEEIPSIALLFNVRAEAIPVSISIPRVLCYTTPTRLADLSLAIQLFMPIYGIVSISVFPPNSALPDPLPPIVPSPENILEHMKLTKSDAIETFPTFVRIWASMPEAIEYLKTLRSVGWAGGPLPPKLGNLLSEAGVMLRPLYGATEIGINTRYIPIAIKDPEDWEYMQFQDHMNSNEKHETMLNNLPDVPGYATSDLWRPHPTKKGLWKIVGRTDDVIVHSSGEKTVPAPMEAIVVSNPLVEGAVIFGRERDQTGILIEPKVGIEIDVEDHIQLASLRNTLWPTIEEANNIAPAHSRIFKEMILFTLKGKPLPRTVKGSVLRKVALKDYEKEIDAIYDDVEAAVGEASSPISWSVTDIEAWLLEQASDLVSGRIISPVVDLFEQGFDSLYATSLRLRIANAMRTSEDSKCRGIAKNLSPNLVYSYPIIKDLAAFISSLLTSSGVVQDDTASRESAAMEAMIAKYSSGLETPLPNTTQSSASSSAVVLLTGSTGHLGSQILAMLLDDSRVEKVYAYNRPPKTGTKTLLQRHSEKFEEIGLNVELLKSEKLVLISGDAAEPSLGLDQDLYSLLRQTVNILIHNAWRVEFNLSLASFEPNVKGTRHFIDLVRSSPKPLNSRFLFISSIAGVQNWDKSKGAVPEDVMEDVSVALGGGYGEGKHVAERILLKSGLQSPIIRVGQISGGRPRGVWPITEWLPILFKSSLSLGAIPESSGIASWLGADTLSATIVDLALSEHSTPLPRALNLVHPRPVQQSVIIRSIKKAIAEILGHDLKLIPLNQWFRILEERAENATAETWTDIPAIKLLEFFRSYASDSAAQSEAGGLPILSTEKVQRISRFMSPEKLQQIGDDEAKLWVSYWHSIGFLN